LAEKTIVNGIEALTDRTGIEVTQEDIDIELEAQRMWDAAQLADGGGYTNNDAPDPETGEVPPEPIPIWTPPPPGSDWKPGRIPPISMVPKPKIVDKEPDWRSNDYPWAFRWPAGGGPAPDQWSVFIDPKTMVPPGSLYESYFEWALQVTDAPLSHHWAVFTTALGSVLGPGHVIEHGMNKVTPNIYTVIITESGAAKSYAMNMLLKMLPKQMATETVPSSHSALLDMFAESGWRLFSLDEAGALFSQLVTNWNASLTHFLIRAYGGDEISTRARGQGKSVTAKVESASIIGATTHEQLGNLPRRELEQVLRGGLFGRFFLCPGRPARDYATWKPEPLSADPEFQKMLGAWLSNIYVTTPTKDKNGERPEPHLYKLEPGARIELCRWLYQLGPHAPTSLLGPIWRRLGLFAKKLALIYHVSCGLDWETPISERTLVCAMHTITYYLIPAYRVLVEQMGNTAFQAVINKVRDHVLNSPNGVRYGDICGACGIRREERIDALVALHGDIHYESWQDYNKKGRPHLVIVWGKQTLPLENENGRSMRPGEGRLEGGCNTSPPETVERALQERKDWPEQAKFEEAEMPDPSSYCG